MENKFKVAIADDNERIISVLENILEDDKEMEHYNADTSISLRGFPGITMTLEEIFDKVEE